MQDICDFLQSVLSLPDVKSGSTWVTLEIVKILNLNKLTCDILSCGLSAKFGCYH
jgi:hypothetical protein